MSSRASLARRVRRKIPLADNSSIDHRVAEGRRIVIATHPARVAGGNTIWIRSPLWSDADSKGEVSSIRWQVAFATSFASRRHHA